MNVKFGLLTPQSFFYAPAKGEYQHINVEVAGVVLDGFPYSATAWSEQDNDDFRVQFASPIGSPKNNHRVHLQLLRDNGERDIIVITPERHAERYTLKNADPNNIEITLQDSTTLAPEPIKGLVKDSLELQQRYNNALSQGRFVRIG